MIAAALVGALVSGTMAVPARAATAPDPRLVGQREKLHSDGGPAAGVAHAVKRAADAVLAAPVWPKPGRATVSLPAAAGPGATGAAGRHMRAGALPVSVRRASGVAGGRPAAVSVEVLDRAAVPARWRDGLLLRVAGDTDSAASPAAAVTGQAGAADVSVDYRAFRNAFGGSWSSRLKLWRVPECALVTPDRPECTATPLTSRNDGTAVTAEVPVAVAAPGARAAGTGGASTLVALAAAAAGAEGDFAATPLAASSTWSAGTATGGFAWSYPMRTPPAIGGPAPVLGLSYSSDTMDGRSDATNNQPSWVGEGFDLWSGYIERTYVPCADDMAGGNNTKRTGDQCWRSQNATMSLNGRGSELVFEAGKGWHPRTADGSRVERLTGATNGDNDGEYWRVTTPDGVQYYFGLNRLPGQSATTDSTWTVPVAGNHAPDECHSPAGFGASFCDQAWRWNLDYVVDPRGNTVSYWYAPEENRYARNATSTTKARYIRGGTLSRIDYGTWDRGAADRSVRPLAQVVFGVDHRCAADCGTYDAAHWKDVPWDQNCAATAADCGENYAPTFWTTKRLATVTTRVWDTTTPTPDWQPVDSWRLGHSYPAVGDGSDHARLWLNSIERAGHVGGTVTMPPVTFDPVSLPNRVLTKHNTSNNRMRIGNIVTETGAKIQITYSQRDCAGSSPAVPDTNTRRCYPVVGPDPYDYDGPDITEWWHKYVVDQVSESDLMVQANGSDRGQPVQNTYYRYLGTPAWHYADDNGLVKPRRKTWNQFRGYQQVEIREGDAPNQTLTRTTFLRGMHGDRAGPAGGTRSVIVGASLGTETVYDEDQFAGMVREQVVYNGVDTRPVSKTVNVPWRSAPTASRTINGDTVTARFTGTRVAYSGTALGADGASGWRVARTVTDFDDTYGAKDSIQNDGDVAKAGDETCTTYAYNRNAARNIVQSVKRITVKAVTCATAPAGPADIVADERKFYDGAASVDTAPTSGAVTRVDKLKDWSVAGGTVWQTVSQATFDAYGRPTSATDVRGRTVTTAYTPATGGPVTKVTTSTPDPNGGATPWSTVIDQLPYWGSPSRTTDFNGRTADMEYDPLGRLARAWAVGWSRAEAPNSPSVAHTYVYAPGRDQYPYTRTRTLHAGGGYLTTYDIRDAFLRPRQTQTEGVGGDRVISDTLHDNVGRIVSTYPAHAEPGVPDGRLWWQPEWTVPAVSRTVHDNASRVRHEIFLGTDGVTNLVEKWRTTTDHLGDATKVTPPNGGTATTTRSDVAGRTVELRQHLDGTAAGPQHVTTYTYNRKGQLSLVVDTAGDEWSFGYDIKGRKVSAKDPDRGITTNDYNDYDELIKTSDANGTLATEYDALGRRIGLYQENIAPANKRVEWKYDRLFTGQTVRGQLAESTRYEPAGSGNAYTYRIGRYNTRYQPTAVDYLIPAAEGSGLNGTWSYGLDYSGFTGAPTSVKYPVAGGLTGETVETKYDRTTGLPTELATSLFDVGRYVIGQQYTQYGEPTLTTRKTDGGVYVQDATSYDLTTRRVDRYRVLPETGAGTVVDTRYDYDAAGNIRSVADTPQVGSADVQCFRYDGLRRLTRAWTPAAVEGCAAEPTTAGLGGPAPYWHDWTFDAVGNRRTETVHTAAGDTTRTYQAPIAGKGVVRPHAVTSVTTQTPGLSALTNQYRYDDTGNLTCRPVGPAANDCATGEGSQSLAWNAEGKLASVAAGGRTVQTNVYDADGNRLIRRDATGTSLYLPGQEIRRDASSVVTGNRYYSFAGKLIGNRTSSGVTWLYGDHQGTQSTAVDARTQRVSVRRQTPYGDPRGGQPQWTNEKGFVGGDKDPVGLTHVGARQYDSGLGRFISVDPVQDLADPQQWNAYAYSNNNPITFSDPSGLKHCSDDLCGGGADYEDPDGNVVETRGDNDGCGGSCGDDDWARARADHERRGGGGGGDGGNGRGGGRDGPSDEQVKHAKEVKKQNAISIIIKAGAGLLLEFFGINDIMGCVHGELKKCAWALIGMLPWGKAMQLMRKIKPITQGLGRAGTALMRWYKESKWADDIIEQAESCARHSFARGTRVVMAGGKRKPIEQVKVGDRVVATDPTSGRTEARKVTQLHVNRDTDMTDLKVQSASGAVATVKTTQHHPIWSIDRQEWVNAAELKVGEDLRTLDRGVMTVRSVLSYASNRTMHDLTVADIHTYYVMAGNTPVLVHNCGKNQGVYEFPDQLNPGKMYVGKTNNFDRRLQHWIDEGRLRSRGDATCTHVCGTGDDLFVAEHRRMEELRKQGVPLSNEKTSPGKSILERRQYEQLELW